MSTADILTIIIVIAEVAIITWATWPKEPTAATHRHLAGIIMMLAIICIVLVNLAVHIEDKGIMVVTPTSESAK